jgi:uncharacterized Zn-finger protein
MSPYVAVAGFNQVYTMSCSLTAGTAAQFGTGSGGLILQGLGAGYVQVFSVDSSGNVSIAGNVSKGSGSFKIDHPSIRPTSIFPIPSSESPDMMHIYNGLAALDSKGQAW